MSFTEHDVTAMHGELKAVHKHVCKLFMFGVLGTPYKLEKMNHLRLREKLTAWRRHQGFDMIEVQNKRQHRSQGHVC